MASKKYVAVERLWNPDTDTTYLPGDVVDTTKYTPDRLRANLELNLIREADDKPLVTEK